MEKAYTVAFSFAAHAKPNLTNTAIYSTTTWTGCKQNIPMGQVYLNRPELNHIMRISEHDREHSRKRNFKNVFNY